MCRPGELGVVISRYNKLDGYDWLAIPLIPYLYSVDRVADIPKSVDAEQVAALRDAYRKKYLRDLAPDPADGKIPGGNWTQLVGSSYDRAIRGFVGDTTLEQDRRMIAIFNDERNVSHFNIFFDNCADLTRVVLDRYFPHSVHRNFIADAGMMTPKQVARSLVKYGKKHPEVHMTVFLIPQVPGSISRSHGTDGIAETLVKSKKYLLPLIVLNPEVAGGVVAAYLVEGRMSLPKDTKVFEIGTAAPTRGQKPEMLAPHVELVNTPVPAKSKDGEITLGTPSAQH
jgi:hypothetical protein